MKNSFYAYGTHVVKAILQNKKRKIYEILVAEDRNRNYEKKFDFLSDYYDKVTIIDQIRMTKILNTDSHQKIACLTDKIESYDIKNIKNLSNRIIILDKLTDPQNIGAIIRSAVAFGINTIISCKDDSPQECAGILKAAVGYYENINYVRVVNLKYATEYLKSINYWIAALTADGTQEISSIKNYDKLAIIIGSEGKGVRQSILNYSDLQVKINTKIESLNASAAAAIAIYNSI